jgi:pimeloyl-ACP methyl ester carboxylesterase
VGYGGADEGLVTVLLHLPAETVRGADVATVVVGGASGGGQAPWGDLDQTKRTAGAYTLELAVPAGATALSVPVCAGRGALSVDGTVVPLAPGPVSVPLDGTAGHTVTLRVQVSGYESRITCGEPFVTGAVAPTDGGLVEIDVPSTASAASGGGHAVAFIPRGHDASVPGPLLVGLHPWNGTMWTYAAYSELLAEAQTKDVVLLFPSGLGNSLYTAPAEDEAMRAMAALAARVAVDPHRVSVWGASMGGAGATTIAFHRPDRFAGVTSFFGDSEYDLHSYVHSILHDAAGAHKVNALDVVENARHLSVWLIHGTADKVSSPVQSAKLAAALEKNGFNVRYDRIEGRGHEGSLVAEHVREVVDRAAVAYAPEHPEHVSYRSVRAGDDGAYGVHLIRRDPRKDAAFEIERRGAEVHVLVAENVQRLVLDPGALGIEPGTNARVVRARGVPVVTVSLP